MNHAESFNQPVTLTINLRGLVGEEGLPQGWDSVLYHLVDPETGRLEEVPVTFDPEAGTFTAQLEHFSTYSAGASDEDEGWEPLLTPPVPDLFSGAATYQYPIEMPPGRNGLQPQISLVYNSRGIDGLVTTASINNGPIGLGWTVGSIAGIVRSTKVNDEGELTIYDEYSLTLNGTSHELEPATANPCGRYYARNAPSLYIERYNAACGNGSTSYTSDYWIVRQPDGTELSLGYKEEAQTWMHSNEEHTFNGFCVPAGQGKENHCATGWQVDQITDMMGNRVEFDYEMKGFGGSLHYRKIRVAEIRYNNYEDNGTKWLSKMTFTLEHDDPTKLRFDTIRVYHAGTELRYYFLETDRQSWNTGRVTSDRAVLSIQEFSGDGSSLPKTTFEHEPKPNSWHNSFLYRRVIAVRNGYGGKTVFEYKHDDRAAGDNDIPDFGYSYRVREVRTYDEPDATTPAHITRYTYGIHCYNQTWSGDEYLGDGVQCQGRRPPRVSPLVGHS